MDRQKAATREALSGIYTLLLMSFVLATLALAQDILIPLALAILLTFLVSPLVSRLERWLGRAISVISVVLMLLCIAGTAAWVLSSQLIELGVRLPDYKDNIRAKIKAMELPQPGAFNRISEMVEEIKEDVIPDNERATMAAAATPVVEVDAEEDATDRPLEIARKLLAPLVGPIGTAGLVLLLLVFMLLQREDLRGRFIRLVGKGRISHTTRAMDDAASRVSRFLLMQLVVNLTYGIAVAIGLSLIGIPSAILCGTLAAVLRFIPYIGPWIGAAIPILLSLVIFDNWTIPLLTIGLFVVLELLSNNLMEPLLYGASTGVSATALIVAAVFWTWLWGPMGLVLSTPLTVVLVVIGRHVPKLDFLSVLLSDERPLTADEECYHRLLAHNPAQAGELVDAFVRKHSAAALFDTMLIPVITRVELDEAADAIDNERRIGLLESIRGLIEATGAAAAAAPVSATTETPFHVACIPARAERDELAAAMLGQLLTHEGISADIASAEMTAGELIEWAARLAPPAVCISTVAPSTLVHARYLAAKLRARLPNAIIVAGLWGLAEHRDEAKRRLRASGADYLATSLTEALATLKKAGGIDTAAEDTKARDIAVHRDAVAEALLPAG